jgi:putative intracellular protease/amidase
MDLYKDETSAKLIEAFFDAGKPTAAVCHAPAVFDLAKSGGKPIVAGREVTGFSNVEEEQVKKTDSECRHAGPHEVSSSRAELAILTEESLKKNGGNYVKASEP